MKKLSKSEVSKLKFARHNDVTQACLDLDTGEAFLLLRDEYDMKSPLPQYLGSSQNSRDGILNKAGVRVSIKTLLDGSGWVITRRPDRFPEEINEVKNKR